MIYYQIIRVSHGQETFFEDIYEHHALALAETRAAICNRIARHHRTGSLTSFYVQTYTTF